MTRKIFSRHNLRLLLRPLPFLIAVVVIVVFVYTQPTAAKQLWDQFWSRFKQQQPAPVFEPVNLFNQLRQDNNIAPFEEETSLNQAARLLAVAFASDPDQEQFTIKEAAAISGYRYESVAFFSLFYGEFNLESPEDVLLSAENRQEVLKPEYKDIGSATIPVPDSPGTLATVVIIAQPAKSLPSVPRQNPTFYTGVQLWEEIQKYRREHGVPEFQQSNVLCTIASIRVNQLIELGTLDDHRGFEPLVNEYRDKGQLTFTNVAENILSGYETPQTAVAAWDGSLGHRSLMRDGSYVWGCAAANHGFGVLVAAF